MMVEREGSKDFSPFLPLLDKFSMWHTTTYSVFPPTKRCQPLFFHHRWELPLDKHKLLRLIHGQLISAKRLVEQRDSRGTATCKVRVTWQMETAECYFSVALPACLLLRDPLRSAQHNCSFNKSKEINNKIDKILQQRGKIHKGWNLPSLIESYYCESNVIDANLFKCKNWASR